MGTAVKHPAQNQVVVIVIFLHPGTLTLNLERHSARMSCDNSGRQRVKPMVHYNVFVVSVLDLSFVIHLPACIDVNGTV